MRNLGVVLIGVANTGVDLGVFVKTLMDDEYRVASGASGARRGFEAGIYDAPRTFGLETRYGF